MHDNKVSKTVEKLFAVGAHLGFGKSRRSAGAVPFILSTKNGTDIINLEKTEEQLAAAKAFMEEAGKAKKVVLFVGTKPEARTIVEEAASKIGMPYVTTRWIGGTFTNFSQMKKRIDKRDDLLAKKASGELEKYTKKERLLIDDELRELEALFGGLQGMAKLPDALFVIDSRREHIAVTEANMMGIPVISLQSTDCSTKGLLHVVVANDTARESIKVFVDELADAYESAA